MTAVKAGIVNITVEYLLLKEFPSQPGVAVRMDSHLFFFQGMLSKTPILLETKRASNSLTASSLLTYHPRGHDCGSLGMTGSLAWISLPFFIVS